VARDQRRNVDHSRKLPDYFRYIIGNSRQSYLKPIDLKILTGQCTFFSAYSQVKNWNYVIRICKYLHFFFARTFWWNFAVNNSFLAGFINVGGEAMYCGWRNVRYNMTLVRNALKNHKFWAMTKNHKMTGRCSCLHFLAGKMFRKALERASLLWYVLQNHNKEHNIMCIRDFLPAKCKQCKYSIWLHIAVDWVNNN
jgi:hypothetical protein